MPFVSSLNFVQQKQTSLTLHLFQKLKLLFQLPYLHSNGALSC